MDYCSYFLLNAIWTAVASCTLSAAVGMERIEGRTVGI